jgi:hypothetical protein
MTDEKWNDLLDTLSQKFDLKRESEETITKDDIGNEMLNEIDRVSFDSPMGGFKIERITRPVILDKKTHYSHTAGTKGLVEYILSPTEKTHKVTVYKKGETGNWEELNINSENLRF